MGFALTEEQPELVATVHSLIAKRAAATDLRAAISSPRVRQHPVADTQRADRRDRARRSRRSTAAPGSRCSRRCSRSRSRPLAAPSPVLGLAGRVRGLLTGADDRQGAAAAADRRRRGRGGRSTGRPVLDGDRADVCSPLRGDGLLELDRRRVTRPGCPPWTRPCGSRHSTPSGGTDRRRRRGARTGELVGAVGVAALQAGLPRGRWR